MRSQWIIKARFCTTDRLSHYLSLQFFCLIFVKYTSFRKKSECGVLMLLLVGSAVYFIFSLQDEPLLRRTTECQLNFMLCHVNRAPGRYRPKLHFHAHFTADHPNLNFIEICWAISELKYVHKQTDRQTRDRHYSLILWEFVTECIIKTDGRIVQ